MHNSNQAMLWAVYRIAGKGEEPGVNAVCDQRDWPQIEKTGAGRCTLVRGFIPSEGEAEQLARGTSGDSRPRVVRTSQFAS